MLEQRQPDAKKTVKDAIQDITDAFAAGKVPNALTDPRYYNIKMMQPEKETA